ncbi:lactate utilization protein [Treponema sp. OttesenSCG-928-L16]|nr:lactate utilization protein [Treponema sp. OttesenSCG-928-L16]
MENQYRKWLGEKRGKKALAALKDKGWQGFYAETLDEAKDILFGQCLPKGVSVGLGGSETLTAMDILPVLRNGEYRLYDRYDCEDHFEVCRESLMADYFITGTNAVTMSGELVNIDCSGSRAAAMAYGPRHIVVVAGVNKLCDTLDEAVKRARSIAPMNCRRNGHRTPCAETGICEDCNIPDRMCNQLLITMNAKKFAGKYSIILVNEDAGF